jgi:hypothetical protein
MKKKLIINRPRSSKNKLCDILSFLKASLIGKNLEIDPPNGFVLFFDGYFSSILFSKLFTSSIGEVIPLVL